MLKFLAKVGNSEAIVIDKAILSLLHISSDTPLEMSTDGRNLVISPISDPEKIREIEMTHRAAKKRFGRAFKSRVVLPAQTLAGLTRVNVAVPGLAPDIVFHMGMGKGYFEKEGLDVRLVPFTGGFGVGICALVNGTADVAAGTFSANLLGPMREAGIKMVATGARLVKGLPASNYCVVRKDLSGRLKTFADLKDRVIATPTEGSVSHIWLSRRLEKAGLRRDDFTIRFLPVDVLPSLLISKEVDVALIPEPLASRLIRTGLAKVFAGTDVAPETYPHTMLYYSKRFMGVPEVARRFMVAVLRSTRAVSRATPKELSDLSIKVWGAPVDADVLARLRFATDGGIDTQWLMAAQEYALGKGWIKTRAEEKDIIDSSHVRYAEEVLRREESARGKGSSKGEI